MEKIGILTWIFYNNFGSVLQAYALGRYLNKQGYYVEYLNYYPNAKFPSSLPDRLKDTNDVKRKIKTIIRDRGIVSNSDLSNRANVMSKFIANNLVLTEECKTNSELRRVCECFDAIIAGSDQIWSPTFFDEKFFLSFLTSKPLKIAYAPSFGERELKNRIIKQKVQKLISDFDYLSIREDSGKEIIYELIGKDVSVVVDPTLLLSKNEWHTFSKEYNGIDCTSEYLLAYFLGDNPKYDKYLKIAKQNGLQVVIIPSKFHDYTDDYHVAQQLTPEQFVYLYEHAKYVCTDSFHGTVFSLIFNKPFLSFERFGRNSTINQNERINTLLALTGLENHYVNKFSKNGWNTLIGDYIISKDLDNRIADSKRYLLTALSKPKQRTNNETISITTDCSGCGLCSIACTKKAICIIKNQQGFYNAEIDQRRCIHCGMCKIICGFNSSFSTIGKDTIVYSMREKNTKSLMKSASGGFATAISQYLIKKGYAIIGCKYDTESNEAIHSIARNEEQLEQFRSSKYLQSHLDRCLENYDFNQKTVVFGTPCQIASLNNYLNIKGVRDQYLLIDLICHGVPSYNMWNSYLKYVQKKYHIDTKAMKVCFRRKLSLKTNQNMNMEILSSGKSIKIKKSKDIFLKMFCLGNAYNLSCYNCNYRDKSAADLRIGDYWGKQFENIPGTSMVIVLTDKGREIIQQIKNEFEINLGNIEDYFSHQQTRNVNQPDSYLDFMIDLKNENIEEVYKKYCDKYYCLEPYKRIIRKVMK